MVNRRDARQSFSEQQAGQQMLHAMLLAQESPNGLALADAVALLCCILRELEKVICSRVLLHLCPSCLI